MRKDLIIFSLLILLFSGFTGFARAHQAVATYYLDGIDLDLGEVEWDRTTLLLVIGDTIDALLEPANFSGDFSPDIDLSMSFDPGTHEINLLLQNAVTVAVLHNTAFEAVTTALLGSLDFSDNSFDIPPITSADVVVVHTTDQRYVKLSIDDVSSLTDFQVRVTFEELPIPEPSTLLLLGAGLLGFLGLARRRTLFLLLFAVLPLVTILNARPLYAEDPIRIQKAGPGSGTVFAGTEVCDAECDELSLLYTDGQAILLKAVAAEGSWFDRWVTPEGSTLSRTFTPQPGDTVVAVFAKELPSGSGTISSSDGIVQVTIPAGAVDAPLFVSMTRLLFAPSEFSNAYDIRVCTPEGTPVTQFDPALTITMEYDPETASGTFVYSPAMYYYAEATGQWMALPSTVDYNAHTVTASTTHLTIFKLISGCPPGVTSCQVSLSAPSNGSQTNDSTPNYIWKKEDFDYDRYCLQVKQDGDNGDFRLAGNTEEDCYEPSTVCSEGSCEVTPAKYLNDKGEYNLSSLPEGSYRWRVKTWEEYQIFNGINYGYGDWSADSIEGGWEFTIDTTAPTPGNGGALGMELKDNGVKLSWVAATDGYTEQSLLEYLIYYSTSDNLNDPETIDTKGTLVDNPIISQEVGTSKLSTTLGSDLFSEPEYYFNVLVQDEAGNASVYNAQSVAFADVCQVTSNADSGNGTLRQVLADAETNGCSTITFADGITQINLETQLEIQAGTLTLDGKNKVNSVDSHVTISGQEKTRVFYIEGVQTEVTFQNLMITEGWVLYYSGAGIYNDGGTIILGTEGVISGNIAENTSHNGGGAGIYNDGGRIVIKKDGAVDHNTIRGSGADGGGIHNRNSGTITAEKDASISYNTVLGGDGGAIFNFYNAGKVTINGTLRHNTAVSGGAIYSMAGYVGFPGAEVIIDADALINENTAGQNGGGVCNGALVIMKGNISENRAETGKGGGIYNEGDGNVTLEGLISGNSVGTNGMGGGVYVESGTLTISGNSKIIGNNANNLLGGIGGGIYAVGSNMVDGATAATVYGNLAATCHDYYSNTEGCLLPPDFDNDGVSDISDNCPTVPNPHQISTDPNSGCRLIDNDDGTITDMDNNLMWERMPNNNHLNWCEATESVAPCSSSTLAGYGDWRLASKVDFKALTGATCDDSSSCPDWILPAGHPFQDIGISYWTSTTNASDPATCTPPMPAGSAWLVRFFDGRLLLGNSFSDNYAWCVRH